ncbi:unnamed protein product [Tilletia controversa]|nr:hypothetical protein CF328_g1598 [Tilletia controversa]CAD6915881.1 unnamed protein product [Tilletia controversa]CAD6935040.1 unnamed protein product [Tilletia controversa]CAD6973357.1 unnamed protein product [Tilletia controversa]CAD6976018.1 unnamed protein product [Tilletia controversa]
MAGFVQHDRHTAALEPTATPILALKDNDRDFLGDELVKNFNDLKTCSPLVRYIVNPVLFNIRAILNDIYSNHRVHFEKVQRLATLITGLLYRLIHPFEDTEFVQVPNTQLLNMVTQLLNMVLHLDSKVMKIRVDIKACQRITASSKLALWYRNRTMRRIIRKATADVKNKKYLDEVKVFCERYDKNVFQSAAALQSPAEPIAQERERQEEKRFTRLVNKILDEREVIHP